MSIIKKIIEFNSPKNVMRRIDAISEFSKKLTPIVKLIILLLLAFWLFDIIDNDLDIDIYFNE